MIVVFDLDDTLYPEIDFVKSGYKAVAEFLDSQRQKELFDFMWMLFESGDRRRIFDTVLEQFSFSETVDHCVNVYRFHKPDLSLDSSVLSFLELCRVKWRIGLITDGPYRMQEQKVEALGLGMFIDFPVFTDKYAAPKPNELPYRMIMNTYSDSSYVYISDNPQKDFVAPIKLGWRSIRVLRENGIYNRYPTPEGIPEISSVTESLTYLEQWSSESK